MDKQITKQMIRKGLWQNLIRFVKDPNNKEEGCVCEIGTTWFYFGGRTAAQTPPEEYLSTVGEEAAAAEIMATLTELRTESKDDYEACLSFLNKNLSRWCKTTLMLDTSQRLWRIDAWETNGAAEEPKAVAYIDDLTARVIYVSDGAKGDRTIEKMIATAKEKIEHNRTAVSIDEDGTPTLLLRTPSCTMRADIETEEHVGYDAIYTGIVRDKEDPRDICSVRKQKEVFDIRCWYDLSNEFICENIPVIE